MTTIKILDRNGLVLTEASLPDGLVAGRPGGSAKHSETRSEAIVSGTASKFEASDGQTTLRGSVRKKLHCDDFALSGEVVLNTLAIHIGHIVTVQISTQNKT